MSPNNETIVDVRLFPHLQFVGVLSTFSVTLLIIQIHANDNQQYFFTFEEDNITISFHSLYLRGNVKNVLINFKVNKTTWSSGQSSPKKTKNRVLLRTFISR